MMFKVTLWLFPNQDALLSESRPVRTEENEDLLSNLEPYELNVRGPRARRAQPPLSKNKILVASNRLLVTSNRLLSEWLHDLMNTPAAQILERPEEKSFGGRVWGSNVKLTYDPVWFRLDRKQLGIEPGYVLALETVSPTQEDVESSKGWMTKITFAFRTY